MRVKNTARPARVREFDREGWPELTKVEYDVHLTGRCQDQSIFWGLAGPYWFGRAFEKPPFFTWSATNLARNEDGTLPDSAPQMTAGVAEWLTDENGMYMGAMIWFQVGIFSPSSCCVPV